MTSWKTTIGGLLGALGTTLSGYSDPTVHLVGTVLTAIGLFLLGVSAKDNNVTGGTKQQ
jgi:hypothetical protein